MNFPYRVIAKYIAFHDIPLSQNLPATQHPEIFGMHENVDISRELQETRLLFDSCLLTIGGQGGGGGSTDEALADIATDILSKVKFCVRVRHCLM